MRCRTFVFAMLCGCLLAGCSGKDETKTAEAGSGAGKETPAPVAKKTEGAPAGSEAAPKTGEPKTAEKSNVLSGPGAKAENAASDGAAKTDIARFVGDWTVSVDMDRLTPEQKQSAQEHDPGKGTLSVRPDGTWEMVMQVEQMKTTARGSSKVAGDKLTLVPSEMNGQPPATPQDKAPTVVALSSDGTTMTGADESFPFKITKR